MQSPSASDRAAWTARVGDRDLHGELLDTLSCLHECEGEGSVASLNGWVRVVAWNVQRGRRPAELAALLATTGAEIAMLSELDSGMARTRNDDVPNLVAGALDAGYTYGVEFVELGLGDELEQREAAGTENGRGLHGNAIVSPAELIGPRVVRLPDSGPRWFAADSAQPRVGGRMGVLATVTIDGLPVQVASTHLENRTDGEHRAEQLEVLLSAVAERAGGGPAVVGGDFNTLGAPFADLFDRAIERTLRAADPARFSWPVAYEPLFEVAAAHDFTWVDANVAAPTTEHDAAGLPDHVPIKLDWLLVRGLEARRPAVVPVGRLSDHRIVSCSIRVSR
jgi:endonuclease/exonuclease/phosphatase family metal-dependent hydrolase